MRGPLSSPTSRSSTTIPSSVLAHARRQHRWVRGDWQILLWLFPFVPTRTGVARNRLPLISRWKILDNLRRSLVAPATATLLVLGWTILPGSPLVWTLVTLAALTFSPSLWLVEAVAGPGPLQPWRVMLRNLDDDVRTALARAGLQLTFLAYHACEMTHAILVTLGRVMVTHRKMLEWQPAATVARMTGAAARSGSRLFIEQMLASPMFAARLADRRDPAAATRVAGGRPDSPLMDRRAARRLCPQSAGRATAEADRAGGPPADASHRAENLALLRHVRGTARPRPAARQRAGDARARSWRIARHRPTSG